MFSGYNTSNTKVAHAGIYLGNNEVIHASGTVANGGKIRVSKMQNNENGFGLYKQPIIAIRRVLER